MKEKESHDAGREARRDMAARRDQPGRRDERVARFLGGLLYEDRRGATRRRAEPPEPREEDEST